MTSKETLRLYQYSNIGYYLRFIPVANILDTRDNVVSFKTISVSDNKWNKFLWYIIASCNIGARLFFIGGGIWFELTQPKVSMVETAQFGFVAVCLATSLGIQLTNLFFLKKVEDMATGFNLFNRKVVTMLKINQNKKDGGEKLFNFMLWTGVIVVIGTFPTALVVCYFGVHAHRLYSKGSFVRSFWIASFMTGGIAMDWTFVYHYVASALTYSTVTSRCFTLGKWRPGLTPAERRDRLTLFNAFQVYQRFIMDECHVSEGVLLSISAAIGLMIVPAFALIAYWEHITIMFLILFALIFLVTCGMLNTILALCNELIDISADFAASYLGPGKMSLSPYEHRCFKCCRPIEIPIGPFAEIQRETFPFVMSEIVIAYIIDFVLAAPRAHISG